MILGYDWLGWKKKINSETLNLMFTFDTVRTFHRVDIHTNNHFSKDIQIFRRAKIYFSNEVNKSNTSYLSPIKHLMTKFAVRVFE